jgi:hypothetical protein
MTRRLRSVTSARRHVAGSCYRLLGQAVAPKTPLSRVTLENAEESFCMESAIATLAERQLSESEILVQAL